MSHSAHAMNYSPERLLYICVPETWSGPAFPGKMTSTGSGKCIPRIRFVQPANQNTRKVAVMHQMDAHRP